MPLDSGTNRRVTLPRVVNDRIGKPGIVDPTQSEILQVPALDNRFKNINYRTVVVPLIAQTNLEVKVSGTLIFLCKDNTSLTNVQVRFNNVQNDPIPFTGGMSIAGIPFEKLYFTTTADGGNATFLVVVERPEQPIEILV